MNAVVDARALVEEPVTKETARPMLEQLRAARADGLVPEREYHARLEQLVKVEVGEDAPAPNLHQTMQDRFDAQIAETMKPGLPDEFALERDPALPPMTDEELEVDTTVREALTAAEIPARLGGTLVERINHVAREFGPLSTDERQARQVSFRAQLQAKWGSNYEARSKAVDAYLHELGNKHDLIADIVDKAPWLLADMYVAESLWSIVEHKMGGRPHAKP